MTFTPVLNRWCAGLTFLVSVAYIPGVMSVSTLGRWWVMGVGAAVLLLLWVRSRPGPGHWAGLAALAWAAAGAAWSVSPWDTLGAVAQLYILWLVFCVGAEASTLRQTWAALGWGLLASAVVVVLQLGGLDPVQRATGGPTGLFLSRTALAEVGAVALVGLLFYRRWALVPAAVLCALAPMSRGALLALGVVGVVVAVRSLRPRWLGQACLVGLPLLGVLLLWDATEVPGRLHSATERVAIWLDTWTNLTLLGHGAGTFGTVFPRWEHSHNEPLQAMFELGVGAVAPAALLSWALLWKDPKDASYQAERMGLLAILVMSLVSFPLHVPSTALLAALLAGHLCGAHDRARRAERNQRAGGLSGADLVWDARPGAVRQADLGGHDLPPGPQPALGRGAVPAGVR